MTEPQPPPTKHVRVKVAAGLLGLAMAADTASTAALMWGAPTPAFWLTVSATVCKAAAKTVDRPVRY
jgi:hypothetical protein